MSKSDSKTKQDKPFRDLERYAFRVLLLRNSRDFAEVSKAICASLGIEELPAFEEESFSTDEGERSFKYLSLPGKTVPVYVMFLQNRDLGSRRVLDIFELTAHLKQPGIIYVSHSAIPLFKLAFLNNFPSILFHDEEEANVYFAKNLIGNDEKEILFSLRQKQLYVTQQVKTRKEFAQSKKDHAAPKPTSAGNVSQESEATPPRRSSKPKAPSKPVQAREKAPPAQEKSVFNTPSAKTNSSKNHGKTPTTPYKAILENPSSRKEATGSKGSSWNLPVDVAFSRVQGEGPRVIDRDALQHMVGSGSAFDADRRN